MRSDALRNDTIFQHSREHRAPLTAFANVAALLAALPFSRDVSPEEQAAVVAAITAECSGTTAAFWQAILVIAFEPMLRAMADAWPKLSREESESIVLLSFFEAVKSARESKVVTPILSYLRRATAGGAARLALRELAEGEYLSEDADASEKLSAPPDAGPHRDAVTFARALAPREADDAELIAMLVATVQGESLADYVARSYPDADARERSRTYQRLLRKRARAFSRKRSTPSSVH